MASGAVRLVARHAAFQGEWSLKAAEAVECAGDQQRYWDYRAQLYAADPAQGPARFSSDRLKGYASELGLAMGQFAGCLDSGRYRDRVAADLAEARRRGVESTPTFFVGDERIVGIPAPGQLLTSVERQRPR